MVIDFSQPITDLQGKPVKEADETVVTLAHIAITALTRPDEEATGAEKLARFKIANVIATGTGPVTLEIEDVALIKKLIGTNPWPLIVGRSFELIG